MRTGIRSSSPTDGSPSQASGRLRSRRRSSRSTAASSHRLVLLSEGGGVSDTIPCVKLPPLNGIPKIPLLGGAELRGLVDLSLGPPTDCRVTFSLLLQLTPFLANL